MRPCSRSTSGRGCQPTFAPTQPASSSEASHSHSRNGDSCATSAFHSARGTLATPSSSSISAPTRLILVSAARRDPRRARYRHAMANDPGQPGGPPVGPQRGAPRREGEVLTATRPKVARPPKYKVILYNDDYTPMEFVVAILENLFGKGPTEATQIMLAIHRTGLGIAGVYVQEIAETKVAAVHAAAEQRGFPLRAGAEKE